MESHPLYQRAKRLGIFSVLDQFERYEKEPWLPSFIEHEERTRCARSMERRIKNCKSGRFRPMANFDWNRLPKNDRATVEGFFSFEFIRQNENLVFIGKNGLGKSMLARNLVHEAARSGFSSYFVDAVHMVNKLEDCATSSLLERRIRQFSRPRLLAIDELGFTTFSSRGSDLFFQVIKERYENAATIITTNRNPENWGEIFPSKAIASAILDRLLHHSDVLAVDGESYRIFESIQKKASKPKQT
jgi:DNA replication protein DnaC